MTVKVIRRGWEPFTASWYRSTDGRFEIFAVGSGGYDLYEGAVKLGRFPHVDAAVAEAKNRRAKGRKS